MSTSAAKRLNAATVKPPRPNLLFKLEDVTLQDPSGPIRKWDVWDAVTSAKVNLTTQGASTFDAELEDADYAFLNDPLLAGWGYGIVDVSPSSARAYKTSRITNATDNTRQGLNSDMEWVLGQRPIDLNLDDIWFRLAAIQTKQSILTLTFEDRAASYLRDKKGLRTAQRGKITRAQFVASLCREAGVAYFIPEMNVVQPIAKDVQLSTITDTSGAPGKALTTASNVKVKGTAATQSQIDVLNAALATAVSLNAPVKAQEALVCALIQENSCSNPNPGDAGDRGCLSMIDATVKSTGVNPYDIAAVCNYFLTKGFFGKGGAISLAANQSLSPGAIAQDVQGSAFPTLYSQWEGEAKQIVQAFGGAPSGASTATTSSSYAFTRGPNEDSWDCIQRLASEVGWYAFAVENVLWFVSGDYIYSQRSQMTVERNTRGIDWVDVNLDVGARDGSSEVTVTGRSHLWTAIPGMTATVVKRGPANGIWFVQQAETDLLDDTNGCTITLQKPLPARPEPPATSSTTLPTGGSGSADLAFNAAKMLSDMGLPYLWGGGHGVNGLLGVHKGGPGLDCSGSVCWALHQAGMFDATSASVSGDLEKWGVAGKGQQMTVWANAGHTFIEFNIPGKGHMQLNTSPGPGPRLIPWGGPGEADASSGSFTPRHWPGT